MTSRRLALGLLVAWVALGPASMLGAQAKVDPQSLVGEWVGNWIAGTTSGGVGGRAGMQGPHSMVITRVVGDRVFATIQSREFSGDARGTLSGNQLTFAGERYRMELTIDGNNMRGTRQGGGIPPREIRLVKK